MFGATTRCEGSTTTIDPSPPTNPESEPGEPALPAPLALVHALTSNDTSRRGRSRRMRHAPAIGLAPGSSARAGSVYAIDIKRSPSNVSDVSEAKVH